MSARRTHRSRRWQCSAVLVVAGLLGACDAGVYDDRGTPGTRGAVTTALGRAARAGTAVELPSVVPGDWRRLVFVCPYQDRPAVDRMLGFPWSDFPQMAGTEGAALYVFATESGVTSWAEIERSSGDPCGLSGSADPELSESAQVFSREKSIFQVVADGMTDGGPFYRLLPISGPSARQADLVVTPDPPIPKVGEATVLRITGSAYGGRHLEITQTGFHGPQGSGGSIGDYACPTLPPSDALQVDSVSLDQPYVWRGAGKHKVTLTLGAPCRRLVHPYRVVAEFVVQP